MTDKKRKRTILINSLIICILLLCRIVIMASDEQCKIPELDQYLELRAVEVKDVAGQNKQVIMELWTNKIDFERI